MVIATALETKLNPRILGSASYVESIVDEIMKIVEPLEANAYFLPSSVATNDDPFSALYTGEELETSMLTSNLTLKAKIMEVSKIHVFHI